MGPPGVMNRLARPNIKMFTDDTWLPDRTVVQREKFDEFFESLADDIKLVVIEIGCGESVPKIRKISEELVDLKKKATLVRINPKDWNIPEEHVLLPLGGLEAITKIDKEIMKVENFEKHCSTSSTMYP